ncbi:MAG TPA: EcsC family protein [Thermoanaerobaculia bacterium]|nr:EcsC family protein [Thermoanaerobaculia bacterium]
MIISDTDLRELQEAHDRLENPGLAAKMISVLGRPIELALVRMPSGLQRKVHSITQKSIEKALDVAIGSLRKSKPPGSRRSKDRLHKVFTAASGAAGGAFGVAGLAVELPVSTTAMLRSIADIARSQGEDLRSPESRLSCLQVFALGGPTPADNAGETGYYALRFGLSATIKELAQIVTERGAVREGSPILVRFATAIASRFGVTVSEKVAVQAIPVLGAVGGAAINVLFIHHYQAVARGHFTVRRLERAYGATVIRAAYDALGPATSRRALPAGSPPHPERELFQAGSPLPKPAWQSSGEV